MYDIDINCLKSDEDFLKAMEMHLHYTDSIDIIEDIKRKDIEEISALYLNLLDESSYIKLLIAIYDAFYLDEFMQDAKLSLEDAIAHYNEFKLLNNTRIRLVESQSVLYSVLLYIEQVVLNLNLTGGHIFDDSIYN